MVDDHVQDHIDPPGVCFVNQADQLSFGLIGAGAKAGIHLQEIHDAVSVMATLGLPVLEHRRQPDGAHPQLLEVGQLLTHSLKGSSLPFPCLAIPLLPRWRDRIVEAIYHQEIDPVIAPVHRRWERLGDGFRLAEAGHQDLHLGRMVCSC